MKLKLQAMAVILVSIAGAVQASGTRFNDQSRDLILTFRQPGVIPFVFEVDIGQASLYYGAAPGTTIPITAYDKNAQLATLFNSSSGINSLSWAVSGAVPEWGDSGDPTKPDSTLWVTDPRLISPNTPSTAWVCEPMGNQDLPVNKIVNGILDPAAYYASGIPADATTNTATAVTIPASSIYCGGYSGLGILGNYLGTFQGVVENTTPAAFTYGTAPSRSDLYELQPGSGPGIYRGYFELGTDGSMTFTAGYYPSPNLSIATNSGNANISFQSSWGWTYSLYYTNAAGLSSPVSTWPVLSTTIVGDGNVDQFQMPVSGTTMFYAVSVQ